MAGIGGSWNESFTYDAAGNMLSYSAPFADYRFSYDARNRQTQAFVGAIGTSFLIDGLGQRIAQINVSVPEFFFVYDEAGHPAGKYDFGGNSLWETAWVGDLPVAVTVPQTRGQFYIAPDHLGSPHRIIDTGGAVVWQWNPDPFGNGAPLGAFTYELRFPGQFFDQATRLHYNYFRDYDPRTRCYLESDPIGLAGGINTYAYVGSNPLSRIDPRGLQEIILPFPPELVEPMEMAPPGGTTLDPAGVIPNTCQPNDPNNSDPCKGLRDILKEHEKKLADYEANPSAYDNKGFLGQGRDEQVIAGRIRNLERQIENFRRQLLECEAMHGL